jgi:hypothetical protein
MLRRLFISHPATCGETYGQHARFALGVSYQLFGAAFGALFHALVPALCETTASRTVKRLYPVMTRRSPRAQAPAE